MIVKDFKATTFRAGGWASFDRALSTTRRAAPQQYILKHLLELVLSRSRNRPSSSKRVVRKNGSECTKDEVEGEIARCK